MTRRTSTTPVASPSSRRCRGAEPRHRRPRPHRPAQPRPPRRRRCRPDSGDGAGILTQVPDALPARTSATSSCRRPARTPSAWRSCRRTRPRRPRRAARHRGDRRSRRASRSSAGATCPSSPRSSAGRPAPACRRSSSSSSTGDGRAAQSRASRSTAWPSACASAPSTRLERLLPVAVEPHARLQGHAHHRSSSSAFFPDLSDPRLRVGARRSSTPASRPTRSRAGRWPTRTASSRTTARSTPSRATATGCGPARRCSRAT